MEPLFPNPSRVVTGHDDQGNSIYIDDKQIPMFRTPFNCDFAVLYQTTKFPADLNGEWKDPLVRIPGSLSSDSAVAVRVVDFPAKAKTVRYLTTYRTITAVMICSKGKEDWQARYE
jgi:hypothetical protein